MSGFYKFPYHQYLAAILILMGRLKMEDASRFVEHFDNEKLADDWVDAFTQIERALEACAE